MTARLAMLCTLASRILAITWALTAPASAQFKLEKPHDGRPDEATTAETPGAQDATDPSLADKAPAVDLRPVVRVYSQPARCVPCQQFNAWREATDDAVEPFRWEITDRVPAWCQSVPAFVFRDQNGTERVSYGWTGIDALAATYSRSNPAFSRVPSPGVETPAVLPPAVAVSPRGLSATIDELRRIAGDRGEFAVTFSRPINAEIQPGVTLRAASIKGHWDLSKTPPAIVFDQPQPEGTATIAGFWRVGYKLLGATVDDDKTVSVRTNWRTIRLTIEGGDQ